jgi:hypothetical protein
MRPRHGAARLLGALVLGLLVFVPPAAAAPKVVIFNMYPSPLVKPDRVFFQADAGPYLSDLQWSGWGEPTALGTGKWVLDCSNGGPSCGADDPSESYPARFTLSDLAPCPRLGPDALSYRSGVVEIDRPAGTTTYAFGSDYDFCARRPTLVAARSAVARFATRRLHASHPTVACHVQGSTDVECTARWTRRGRAEKRDFYVSAAMSTTRLYVTPLG